MSLFRYQSWVQSSWLQSSLTLALSWDLLTELCGVWIIPPLLSGSVHSFICRMKPYIERAWKISFCGGLNSVWKLHGCLQSPFSYTIHTQVPQCTSKSYQCARKLEEARGIALHSESSVCQKEQECRVPTVIKPSWEIKHMSYRIGCLFCFPLLHAPLSLIWGRKESKWEGCFK